MDAPQWTKPLRAALDDLPARQRQAVLLRDVEGFSSAEVCRVIEISPGNLRLLLHRGRSRLREALQPMMGSN
jgi:RNA polymerase sigma-70 factor, ECF subfamily